MKYDEGRPSHKEEQKEEELKWEILQVIEK
jgi:hypothetical protein